MLGYRLDAPVRKIIVNIAAHILEHMRLAATRQLGVSLPLTLTLLLVAAAANAVAIVAAGNRSDRFGRRRIMLWGAAALVVWSAAFFPLIDTGSVPLMAVALTVRSYA